MNNIHILLVEDNEGDIILTKKALQDAKLINKLSIVRNGEEALNFFENNSVDIPDLILLDINLPKMNGHEVLKNIKSNEKIKHIPIIMLTTSSSEKDIYSSYQNHANCYITKPVDINEFFKVVSALENFWISIVQLPGKK